MRMTGSFPVLGVEATERSRDFYVRHFGFQLVFDEGWYVQLVHRENPQLQLGLVRRDHNSVPDGFRHTAQGVVMSFEVPDASQALRDLEAQGLQVVQALRDEPWGQRHFMVQAPDGLLVDVIQAIPETAGD